MRDRIKDEVFDTFERSTEIRYAGAVDKELVQDIRRLRRKAKFLAERDPHNDDLAMVLVCLARIETCVLKTEPNSADGSKIRFRLIPILRYLRSKIAQHRCETDSGFQSTNTT